MRFIAMNAMPKLNIASNDIFNKTVKPLLSQSVVFELSGPAEGYVSFALSWDTWMVRKLILYGSLTITDMNIMQNNTTL